MYVKLENLQRTGSYKIRGAYNKLATLTAAERAAGVVAASAGNHAQGVAWSAQKFGIPCTIVMPTGAPVSKIEATQSYGATVVLHGANYDEAYPYARALAERTGATYVHAFDDPAIIAGQGSVGLELLADAVVPDVILVPIGGGGLISGIAVAVKALRPDIRIIGVQAEGAAAMMHSFQLGIPIHLDHVRTVADGIAVKSPGAVTFPLIKQFVDDIVTVTDEQILNAISFYLEREKMLVEGAGAVTLAALLTHNLDVRGKKVAMVVSGGNIDLTRLSHLAPPIQKGIKMSSQSV